MRKYFLIAPMILALGGCLQAGSGPMVACAGSSTDCVRSELAAMNADTGDATRAPGLYNRDGGDGHRGVGDDARGGLSAAGSGNGAAAASGSAGGNNNANADADGDADSGGEGAANGNAQDKGNQGKNGRDRNQNAIEKGDNRFDGAGNADDARR